ncbi:hypothetical protein IT398_02305 [Candidatus Nomurabacteria bacterium]|nr:hypothetical protein [Candidatus Nomurabacteria bacterium]
MVEIIPAIIGIDFLEVKEKISRLEGLVDWAQLDIMDGVFTSEYSWQRPGDLETLDGKVKLEAHLMVRDPEDLIDEWLVVCDRVIIHPESTMQLGEILEKVNQSSTEASLSILMDTPLEKLDSFINQVKSVQLMGIATIGHHGEPLDRRVYDRIKFLRTQYPGVKISVDGGVNLNNAQELIGAGADRLVVGSAIWQSNDIENTINALRRKN